MVKTLLKDPIFLFLLFAAIALKLISLQAHWVEQYYTAGIYPALSEALRTLFGWIPFSVGDLLYLLAFVWLVVKTWRLVRHLQRRIWRTEAAWQLLRKYLKLGLVLYLVFGLLWGLNYNRQGVAKQLGLTLAPYTVADLFSLTLVLQQRLNQYAGMIDSVQRLQYNHNSTLFQKASAVYTAAERTYPFLAYSGASIKPSFFTPVGHLVGFTGYYNPFTAEAQLKTSIPVFLKPFVVSHEVAHQLGYAKENEANFVAYLSCRQSGDKDFLYSAYFELYRDALFACKQTPNNELVKTISQNIHPRVQRDLQDLRLYLQQNQNALEPVMTGLYDQYLKLNNQPKGRATYNEVLAYLVAYLRKFGKDAI